MKICPICDTKFEDEVIRFCTKDGSPLVDEAQPSFVEMPSEALNEPEDDAGEITVVRTKDPVPQAPPPIDDADRPLEPSPAERFVIHTSSPQEREQQVRPRTAQAYYPPPPQSNTLKVVALTVFGTVVVLGLGALLFSLLQKEKPSNSNVNINTNLGSFNQNLNSNLNPNSFNFNTNANFSSNFNAGVGSNINLGSNTTTKSPSPTPTPKPSPSATPTPSGSPSPTPSTRPNTNAMHPPPTPTPRTGPRPTPNPAHTPAN